MHTVNPLFSPPGGLFISTTSERGGLKETEGLFERRGLFNKDDGVRTPERTRTQSEKA